MDNSNNEYKRRIFRQELFTLKDQGYLSDPLVEAVAKAHHQYHLDLVAKEQIVTEIERIQERVEPPVVVSKKPLKIKRVHTPEEIRERNITWLLNLGVLMLLIGGLFVATSNWKSMSAFMKSVSIAGVSLLFYGFAILSKRVLNIEKTAFAFTVLGSLFLPIFVLSLGWFGLLGSYLSITGQGSNYLGMLGSYLPLIVYLNLARILNSRLFVWFSYISLTVGTAFFLAALHLPIDYFYLGMVFYNSVLVFGLYVLKKRERFPLFTKELVVFAQISLILSTLTMIFLYDQYVVNSFNILLTAAIYLSMIFVTGKKEYHFIFSTMVVYGAYQLIEHSFLDVVGPILFALIGISFLFLARFLGVSANLQKIFQITSAIISVLAFLYISLEGLMLRMGEPSFVLLLAYLIIGSHFVYMCYVVRSKLFPYLSSVFYSAALFEMLALVEEYLITIQLSVEIFTVGFLLFLLLSSVNLSTKLRVIRKSSREVGLAFMVLAMIIAQVVSELGELAVMLLCFSIVCYLVTKLEERQIYRELGLWFLPVSLGFAFVSLGIEISLRSEFYNKTFGGVAGFIVGSLIVLLSSFIWSKIDEMKLVNKSFLLAQLFYTAGLGYSIIGPIDPIWVRPVVFLGGICIYLVLYRRTKFRGTPHLIGVTSIMFYFTVMISIEKLFGIPYRWESLVFTSGAVFLLLVAYILKKKSMPLFQGFAWIGHLYYPFSLLFTFIVYNEESIWSFMIAILIYVSSLRMTEYKWHRYVFLYAAFTSLAGLIASGLARYLFSYQDHPPFIITSGIVVLIWFAMNAFYKKTTMYYWVPFSIIGIISYLDTWPYTSIQYMITLAYIVVVLFFIHLNRWVLVPAIPLFLSFVATVNFTTMYEGDVVFYFLLTAGIGIGLSVVGKSLYKKLVNLQSINRPEVDVYSITSILYFLYLYTFDMDIIWLHAVPGVLIAGSIFYQRNRIPRKWSALTSTLAMILLLEPYYSITLRMYIPQLWEREIIVLPWVLLVIFIQKSWKGRYEQISSSIQWTVLIVAALSLVQDGLEGSTIYDAIILGTLSLISILSGMFLRIKSYFLVGCGVLLLNVFLQTRPFWGNMPWWTYLLIAGSILIFVASFNEWHKQKKTKGELTFLAKVKEKLHEKWKQWN